MTSRGARRACRLAWLTVCAWCGIALYDLARCAGFAHVHRFLSGGRPSPHGGIAAADVVWAVDEACVWYVRRVLCLQRSAVAVWLLRRCGLHAQLVVGYRAIPFESHAWAEIDGEVVNDRPQYAKVFTVLDRL